MAGTKHVLLMTTAAALCVAPMLAFGQANTGGSSQMQGTNQTTPQQGAAGGGRAAAPGAPGASAGNPSTGNDARGGVTAQANPRDGTPGNPPSTATQRGADAVTGNRTDPDGTGNNPPGTAAERALDRATGTNTSGTNDGRPGAATGRTTTGTTATGTTAPGTAATGATTGSMAVDSARMQGGRRASKVIGSTVYNENNESIGEVDDIIVPPGGGQPVAILSVGGFLGIGARLVAVPYERLQHAGDRDRWTLQGATKDSLQSLPEYRYEDGGRRG
ncbi:PRC-barrel domain-containing protein [Falsiroseomonas oryzae]|uniref:PRC-barrel domain-containing protein n=1 Tax=Falsiroseomonas oryzae TaxID=2766473 RepID=UPI0022EAAFC2|nr:PRC-barrel domain-containing protein [Roseomonas sp. MO-31]